MEKRRKAYYKYCVVPMCQNNIKTAPGKVYFLMPKDAGLREKWCKAMKRDNVSCLSCLYCCEDHFNIKEDSQNYVQYETMAMHGKRVSLRLKPGVLPHKFACQRVVKPIQKNDQKEIKPRVARQPEKKKNNSLRLNLTPKPRSLRSEEEKEKKILEAHNSSQKQILTPLSQYVSLYSLKSDPESFEKMEVAVERQLPSDGSDGGKELKVKEFDDLYEDLPDSDHEYKPEEDPEFDDSATESAPSELDEPLSPIAFKLEHDMENYIQYKIMGSVKRIRLKPDCMPIRFDCNRKHKKSASKESHLADAKRLRISISEDSVQDSQTAVDVPTMKNKCDKAVQIIQAQKNIATQVVLSQKHKAIQIYKPNFKPDHEESTSRTTFEEGIKPGFFPVATLPKPSGIIHEPIEVSRISHPSRLEKTEDKYELFRQQIEHVMVARVYRYLLKEYYYLKNQFDVSQLADVPRRTAEATGVAEDTVMHILRKQARETQGSALQANVTHVKLDHNYYSCEPRPQRQPKPPRFRLTRPKKVPKDERVGSRTKRLEGPQKNCNKPKTKRRPRKPARYRVTRPKKTPLPKDVRENSRTKRLEEPQNNCNESKNNRGLRRSLRSRAKRLRETVPADISEDSRIERLDEQNNFNECDEQTPSDDAGDLVMKCEVFEDPLQRIEEQEPTACTDEPKLKSERIDDELQIEHVESDFNEETQVQSTAKRRRMKSEPSDEEYQQSCINPASDKTSETMSDDMKTETIDVDVPFLRGEEPPDLKMDTDDAPSPLRKDTDVMSHSSQGMAADRPQRIEEQEPTACTDEPKLKSERIDDELQMCSFSAENLTPKSSPVVKKYKKYIIPPRPPEMPKCSHVVGPDTFRCHLLTSDDITNFHKQFHSIANRSRQHNFILRHVLFKPGVQYSGRNIKLYYISTERGNIKVCIRAFCGVLSIVRTRVHKIVNQYAATGKDPTVQFDKTLCQNKDFLTFQYKKEAVRQFLMKYLPLVSLDSRVSIEKCKSPSPRIVRLYKKYQMQTHHVAVSKQFFTNAYNTYFNNSFGSARGVCKQCALLLNNIDMATSEIEKERCLILYKRHRLRALCYFDELKEFEEMKENKLLINM